MVETRLAHMIVVPPPSICIKCSKQSVEAALGWQCYQQTSALPTFTRQRFPFCKVGTWAKGRGISSEGIDLTGLLA